ncbi:MULTISPECIES: EamA family transporter RarD [unclassified Leptolyngbya]|uniref:EamA family transporter RarD n=1 Tax=unclassified Leptolyngbya TaxID=2650499 RepID=UPI00168A330C|nr:MULTISPECIES: EamA family transporter RarD [unclassified Leptolyngbya]MBD1911903.1 EamA family transporter RarD [Leptolyngbya sp. FACHB-8]MBD2156112.1 EamA family transporter RarD [Leptolyngbya sp. FACHB-16]
MTASSRSSASQGLLFALLAYGAWGLLPIYWKFFGGVPALEVLCHRIVWSSVLLLGVLALQGRWEELQKLWRSPRYIATFTTTAIILSTNWGIYIYAVNANHVVETSLGYFINPLISVLMGCVFLRERLSRWQGLAVFLAFLGVLNFVVNLGKIPWIALGLAISFAVYGLLRKITPVQPMVGLAVETLVITPVALILLGQGAIAGNNHFGFNWTLSLLFIGCGLVTSLPLLWFNNAAHRLPLATLGFMQYIAPSLQLLLGVFLYHEPFTRTHAVSFGLIWAALAIFSTYSWRRSRGASS